MANIIGTNDNDTINGGLGADLIEGGGGNDFLMGSAQSIPQGSHSPFSSIKNSDSDVYVFSRGFGQDTISEDENIPSLLLGSYDLPDRVSPSHDVIRLDASFTPDDVYLELVDDHHLRLQVRNSTDSILFNVGVKTTPGTRAYGEEQSLAGVMPLLGAGVEAIEFADGTVWDTVDVLRRMVSRVVQGDDTDNLLVGGRGDDTLLGGAGNDTLTGAKGGYLIDGGAGNDLVVVTKGANYSAPIATALFNVGSGHDTIVADSNDTVQLGAGLNRSQLQTTHLTEVGNKYGDYVYAGNREFKLNFGTTDSLTLTMSEDIQGKPSIPKVLFADGSMLTLDDVRQLAPPVNQGSSGADKLIAWSGGTNTLAGRGGNDSVYGGVGSRDTVLFNQGDGQDLIFVQGRDDLIVLGSGLLRSNMVVSLIDSTGIYSSPQVVMTWGRDKITVIEASGEFYGSDELVSVKFADGVTLSLQDIVALATKTNVSGTANGDFLYSSTKPPVSIQGLAGDDYMTGSKWADLIDGGTGNDIMFGAGGSDTLRGQSGNDTLYGGRGNDLMEGGAGRDIFRPDEYDFFDVFGTVPVENAPLLAGGNDTMVGGAGADTYLYSSQDDPATIGIGNRGADVILDYDINTLNQDQLVFNGAYNTDQLWFSRSGQDLKITLLGGEDQGGSVTVQKWFTSSAYRIEKLTADHAVSGSVKTLTASRVNNLVNAMSRFAPPAPGATAIDANTQAQLATVLASNWK